MKIKRRKASTENSQESGNLLIVHKSKEGQYYRSINLTCTLDNSLSLKAKGLHTYLMTRPEGWKLWTKNLFTIASDGESSVRSGINELIFHNYLHRFTKRDSKKRIRSWIYLVLPYPVKIKSKEDLKKIDSKLYSQNLYVDFLKVENQVYSNKKDSNKKDSNNNISSKEDILLSSDKRAKKDFAPILQPKASYSDKHYQEESNDNLYEKEIESIFTFWNSLGSPLTKHRTDTKCYHKACRQCR